MDWSGSAVITGAGSGIGRALALELASVGHPVGLQGRNEAKLHEVRAELEGLGGRALVVPGDTTVADSADQLVTKTESAFGPLLVAVAGAGQARSMPLLKTSATDLETLYAVNVLGPFHLLKRAGQALVEHQRGGRLVVVASVASLRGLPYTSAYCASKHAAVGLVRTAALEFAPRGITVNALCPGWVDTPMFDRTLENISKKTGCSVPEAKKQIESNIPMGGVVTTDALRAQFRWVICEAASKLTGQALVLDGGESL